MTRLTNRLNDLRRRAYAGPIGKRQSSRDLYRLLADCYDLALECRRDPTEADELHRLIREEPSAGKGRWVLRGSDEFLLVCRFVFPRTSTGKGELSNASRYAVCLREAEKRQIRPEDLFGFLWEKGGINALYMRRPLAATTVSTKCLHLTRSVTVRKGKTFTLTLRRTPDNLYEVVGFEE